ncbi:hypothetical protein BTA51_01655 [Hahella sp. CCB-MM4]|uniref:hypothetical protein n=1 Tax=Hahella sp. (strain CCB-MM4) TaxID=1926491 RepID=UPI000B9A3CCA|nr:hypothetical protein [Hahella sp. CCB-MM4]OZG75120.1 hypothetical protein BTA51_01655 [Hahella sp. CCB-MM4]
MSVACLISKQLWCRLSSFMAGGLFSAIALAAGQDPIDPIPAFQEKTTLESFNLKSLDSDELADAVIGGALDVPAAGEETEAPGELRKRNNGASDQLLKDEFAIAPTPQTALPEPRLPQVTPIRSVYDVLDVTPR